LSTDHHPLPGRAKDIAQAAVLLTLLLAAAAWAAVLAPPWRPSCAPRPQHAPAGTGAPAPLPCRIHQNPTTTARPHHDFHRQAEPRLARPGFPADGGPGPRPAALPQGTGRPPGRGHRDRKRVV